MICYCFYITLRYGHCDSLINKGYKLYFQKIPVIEDKLQYNLVVDNFIDQERLWRYLYFTKMNTYQNIEIYKLLYKNCIYNHEVRRMLSHPFLLVDTHSEFYSGRFLSRSNYGKHVIIGNRTLSGQYACQNLQLDKIFISRRYVTLVPIENVYDSGTVTYFKNTYKNDILNIVKKYK